MRLVLDRPLEVAQWVAKRIPTMHGQPFHALAWAIGVEDEAGKPLGGVVFTNHLPAYRSIEVSFASDTPRWLTRRMISGILAYPFTQLGCQRITAITPKKAKAARAFLDDFGFKREGVVRRGFGDDDAVISGLLWREWARNRFNVNRRAIRETLTGVEAPLH